MLMCYFTFARAAVAALGLLAAALAPFAASAQPRPGPDAQACVRASTAGEDLTFHNQCGQMVFVVWCGDLRYSKQRCGEGPRGDLSNTFGVG